MKKHVLFSLMLGASALSMNAQYEVTFSVNMQDQTPSPDGVHVAGSWQSEAGLPNDWEPNTAAMTDDDMDGIYTYTCTLPDGIYEFKYINGNAWGGDESVPAACQVGGGNSNRFFVVNGASPLIYPVKFADVVANDGTGNFNMVRFTVDLTGSTVGNGGVSVAGSFMDEIAGGNFADWTPGAAFLTDITPGDANSLHTAIFYFAESLNGTSYEFKYINGQDGSGNNQWENVPSTCTSTSNRSFTLGAGATLTQNCFASCSEVCVELPNYNVTINMDMRYNCGFDVNSNDTVDVAGTFNNYQGGPDYILTDDDNDGIYSITLSIPAGEFQYKARIIRNANFSGGWEGGSNTVVVLGSDSVLSARCFGFPTGECTPIPPPSNITFRVDMTQETPAAEIFLIADFTTPPYQGGATTLTAVSPGIYETTKNDICPGKINYKYVNGPTTVTANEESFPNPDDRTCVEENGIGGYNRVYVRQDGNPVTLYYAFNKCQELTGIDAIPAGSISVAPNPANESLTVRFADGQNYTLSLVDITGKEVMVENNVRYSTVLNRNGLTNGVYLLRYFNNNGNGGVHKVIFE